MLQAPVKFGEPVSFGDYLNVEELFIAEYQEPKTFDDAIRDEQAKQWKAAMKEEMNSLKKNETWEIVNLPKELENKWVYKLKKKADGSIDRYKARLVVKGFTQRPGIDYVETFSPVVKFTSVRAILTVAIAAGMKLYQFDIKTAYLNGNLEEDIYMKQSKGFEDGSEKVCKLKRALYGLKQSARSWNKKFLKVLTKFNLRATDADPCVFINKDNGKTLILAVYVDDGLVASTNNLKIKDLLLHLSNELEVTSKPLELFLGMEFKYFSDGSVQVNQSQYANE